MREMVTIVATQPDPETNGMVVRIVFQEKNQDIIDVLKGPRGTARRSD